MATVTDSERRIAVDGASRMWRSDNRPACHYMFHNCERKTCDMIEIEYAAIVRFGEVMVSLTKPASEMPDAIKRLFPLYGCTKTGQTHACGDGCDQQDLTCSISGIRFREEMRDGWWSEYPRESRNTWKLKVFGQRTHLMIEPLNIREKLSLSGDQTYLATAMLEQSRRRARLSNKSGAFDVAYSIAAVVFSDERFEDTIRRYNEQRANMVEQAKRAATHMMHSRVPVNTANLMQALTPHPEAHPVLIQSKEQTRTLIVRYAEHCIALWHLVRECVNPGIADMSFRDFCTAAMNLFGKGHNVPDWRWGRDTWVVHEDPVLSAFPLNKWAEKKIYSEMKDTKISGVVRRAEARLKEVLDHYVASRDQSAAYIDYKNTPYDAVPEGSFVDIKR